MHRAAQQENCLQTNKTALSRNEMLQMWFYKTFVYNRRAIKPNLTKVTRVGHAVTDKK